jgi:hypothetical protein
MPMPYRHNTHQDDLEWSPESSGTKDRFWPRNMLVLVLVSARVCFSSCRASLRLTPRFRERTLLLNKFFEEPRMDIGLTIALLITTIVTVSGTAIYVELDRASSNPAPKMAYAIFSSILLFVCSALFYWTGFLS